MVTCRLDWSDSKQGQLACSYKDSGWEFYNHPRDCYVLQKYSVCFPLFLSQVFVSVERLAGEIISMQKRHKCHRHSLKELQIRGRGFFRWDWSAAILVWLTDGPPLHTLPPTPPRAGRSSFLPVEEKSSEAVNWISYARRGVGAREWEAVYRAVIYFPRDFSCFCPTTHLLYSFYFYLSYPLLASPPSCLFFWTTSWWKRIV